MVFLLFLLTWTVLNNCTIESQLDPDETWTEEEVSASIKIIELYEALQKKELSADLNNTKDTPSEPKKNDYDDHLEQWIDHELEKVGKCPTCTIL